MTATEIFLSELNKIPVEYEDNRCLFIMTYLQDEIAEKEKFDEFQQILDNLDPNDLHHGEEYNSLVCAVALVGWHYGKKLNRKIYCDKALEFYTKHRGKEEAIKIMKGFATGSWQPQFGFENKLFGITKN